jgi:hypothetical protein
MQAQRLLPQIVLACAVGAGVAACGSSGTSTSAQATSASPSAPSTSASPSSAGGSATQKLIAANWTAFFNAKTPAATRVGLLQDGQEFAAVIKAQAGSGLASEASAKVTKVTLASSSQANVTYSILLAGQPVLQNQAGVAVYQDGTWKVGVASFCGLLATENAGNTSSLPAACKATG